MMTMFAALFCGCGNAKNNEAVKTVNVVEFAEKMAQKDVRLMDVPSRAPLPCGCRQTRR